MLNGLKNDGKSALRTAQASVKQILPNLVGASSRRVAPVITDPARFEPKDFQGNDQHFVLAPTNFDMAAILQRAPK